MDNLDFNKLWQNYVDTITNHYSDMSGRIGRSQFWYYVAVYVVVEIGVAIIGSVVGLQPLFTGAYALALLLPCVGMAARRIQDTGKSGSLGWLWAVPAIVNMLGAVFWVFAIMTLGLGLIFLPFMGIFWLLAVAAAIVLVYLCVQPGEAAANAYGPPPAAWTPGGSAKPPAPAAS